PAERALAASGGRSGGAITPSLAGLSEPHSPSVEGRDFDAAVYYRPAKPRPPVEGHGERVAREAPQRSESPERATPPTAFAASVVRGRLDARAEQRPERRVVRPGA